jgi:hypothetical protein
MSLTEELRDPRGQLARWCAETFTGTGAVVDEVIAATRGTRPVRPQAAELSERHWAQVGGAWGQRLADLVQPAPPYYALLGMVRAGWVTPEWAHDQASAYPTHRTLPLQFARRALDLRPTASGWLDLRMPLRGSRPVARASAERRAGDVWRELLEIRRIHAEAHAATGTLGAPGVESALARSGLLLSACEDVYRSGNVDPRLADALEGCQWPTTRDLHALVDEGQVTELTELATKLQTSGALECLRALGGNPSPGKALGIAAPTIVPRWADGDLLLGAIDPDRGVPPLAGTTLIDVKAVISLRDRDRIARWIWQALACAWLDSADLYRICRVGLLLARHGVLVTWPLEILVERLAGRPDRGDQMRRAFKDVAGRSIRAAGGTFPIA